MTEPVRITLLGGFRLSSAGEEISVPMAAQRVLVFVALQEQPVLRSYVGSTLWLDATEAQAGANLRSALWKLGRTGYGLIEGTSGSLQLASHVTVDLRESIALARLAITSPSRWEPQELDVTLLSQDLLPTWYEEWVLVERERYRQLRLHALESLCDRLIKLSRHGSAVQAALAAVASEPLRESAQRALIKAFLAEGNVSEARRQFEEFKRILREELDLEPSVSLKKLAQGLDC
jgi:DNA-binding SARP family transcriptional activator